MNNFREIVTKAVISKGRKVYLSTHVIALEASAGKVLGCWIINHKHQAMLDKGAVCIAGSYDVHIWYALADLSSTDVHRKTISYYEDMPVRVKEGEMIKETCELKSTCLRYPSCNSLKLIDSTHVEIVIEKEITFDAIGDCVLKVQVSDSFEDDFIREQEIDATINPHYIRKTGS